MFARTSSWSWICQSVGLLLVTATIANCDREFEVFEIPEIEDSTDFEEETDDGASVDVDELDDSESDRPIEPDSDNDGVSDSADLCPETDSPVVVDTWGCYSGDEDDENENDGPDVDENSDEIALTVVEISSLQSEIGLIAQRENGEALVAHVAKDATGAATRISGMTYIDTEGVAVTYWIGENGLPEAALAGERFYQFSNFSNGYVDVIAWSQEDGVRHFEELPFPADVASDMEVLLGLQDFDAAKRSTAARQPIYSPLAVAAKGFQHLDIALSVVGLGIAVTAAAPLEIAIATAGLTIGLADVYGADVEAQGDAFNVLTCAFGDCQGLTTGLFGKLAGWLDHSKLIRPTAEAEIIDSLLMDSMNGDCMATQTAVEVIRTCLLKCLNGGIACVDACPEGLLGAVCAVNCQAVVDQCISHCGMTVDEFQDFEDNATYCDEE